MNVMDAILPAMVISMTISIAIYLWMWSKTCNEQTDPVSGLRHISVIATLHGVIALGALFYCHYCCQ